MEQHPVPRQITTFEFKLVGFMTLRQFLYLVVFIPLAYIVFRIFPIPFLNILIAFVIGAFGVGLAFFPINDRPMDIFIKNLIKRLTGATQYYYKKGGEPIYFLENVSPAADPNKISTHIESQKKLSEYLARTGRVNETLEVGSKKQEITEIFTESPPEPATEKPQEQQAPLPTATKPFIAGVIKNNKQIPLPGILIYLKDQQDTALRLLKTNPHGIFATYNKLPPGDYTFEIKDPKGTFFFDTMKINLQEENPRPVEIYSKELL